MCTTINSTYYLTQFKVVFMDNKAQPALEYLLLIGAAVLVAAIVIVVLGDIFGPTANQTKQTLNHWLTHIN